MCVCTEARKGIISMSSAIGSYRRMWATMQMLGIKRKSSGRAAYAPNPWAISRYLSFAFLKSFSFLEKLIILVLFIYMFSLNISKCTICMHSSWRQEGVRSPGAGVRNNCEASCGHRNPNSDPVQGSKCSSLFLAAQPSLHSWRLIYHFKLSGCGYAHVSAGAHRGQMHWILWSNSHRQEYTGPGNQIHVYYKSHTCT